MSAPLTHGQKRYLSQLSDRAFRFEGAKARGRGETWPEATTAVLAEYRHAEVAKACGKLGLRCCSQDDYKLVEAHFLNLLNQPGKAFAAHVRATTNDDRIAEWKLMQAIKEAAAVGIDRRYAEAICKRQYGCTILEASTKQKWNLMFTIKNRASARRKEHAA